MIVLIHSTPRDRDKNVMPCQSIALLRRPRPAHGMKIDGADVPVYGAARLAEVNHTMMYLDAPPRLIGTEVFSSMPDDYRRKGVRTDWADANRPGQPTDCFIEGPSFDAEGNLYIVDIPFGRIFRIAPDGKWSLAADRKSVV